MSTAQIESENLSIPTLADDILARARRRWKELSICAAAFALLAAWLSIFPYSGDGDSVLHYLNARDGYVDFGNVLHSWARPGFKLLLIWPAMHGIVAARLMMAAVSTILLWQTIRLAEDLRIDNSYLAAPMLLWQSMAFALASDTMSEMPMALGLVIAIRLWLAERIVLSCLVLGFLPSVRPEGFFFGLLWGGMVLARAIQLHSWKKLPLYGAALAAGLVAWVLACWYWTGDPWHVYHIWNWPALSYEAYGHGSIFHYLIGWPVYCGVPMTVLFVLGIKSSWRRAMWLPWTGLLLVFCTHSILYWRGWFAACGLLRIMACTSPLTAMVCLHGWNQARLWMREHDWSQRICRRAGVGFAVVATVWMMAQYCLTTEHFDCFPMHRCVAFIQEHHLVNDKTWFFTGNQLSAADMGFLPRRRLQMETPCDPAKIHANLAALPLGSIGVWDNRQAPVWHGHTIEDLSSNGFTILFDTTTHYFRTPIRYAVVRKDGPFPAVH